MNVTVTIRRWQERQNKYYSETLELTDAKSFLDIISAGGQIRHPQAADTGAKVIRTHQMERVLISQPDTDMLHIEIWLHPAFGSRQLFGKKTTGKNFTDKQADAILEKLDKIRSMIAIPAPAPAEENRSKIGNPDCDNCKGKGCFLCKPE